MSNTIKLTKKEYDRQRYSSPEYKAKRKAYNEKRKALTAQYNQTYYITTTIPKRQAIKSKNCGDQQD